MGLTGHGYYLLILLVGLDWILLGNQRPRIQSVLLTTDRPARQLELLAVLLDQIEREAFEAPLLREMQAELRAGDNRPRSRSDAFRLLLAWMGMRQNMFFMLVDAVVLWTVQFAFAIENWRAAHGERLARWTRVLGEFEALNSLATYAYEHPARSLPGDRRDDGPSVSAGGRVSHPLLPDEQAIRNDVRLDETQRLYIISGSNMSGKSTLLRTVGVNTVLALAGAPVRARPLRPHALHLGASLRTQDSLQGGISRFYAEIQRLRQIVDISRDQPPLLFLLDEILHGTNSHDRRVGAEAVRALPAARRRARPADHPRPDADTDRRRSRPPRHQRPFRRRDRRGQDALRLSPAPRCRHPQQRHRTDARRRPGGLIGR